MSQLAFFNDPAPVARPFELDAMGFLIGFVRRSGGGVFSSEDVSLAARSAGIAPVDMRAWGAVFAQAAREGWIRRSDESYRRVMGNGTLALGWVAA